MATRLKPSRINVDNTPRVGDGASYQNDNDFHWSEGGGDMSYEDFEWETLTGNSLVIEKISNNVTPTGNFTVSAGTLRPGIEYVLRVNTGNTPYTMTLGTGVTNPNGYNTELELNTVNQFKFIATSANQLELEGVDSAVISEINWGGIGGTLSDQTDLQNALDEKQDTLTAGTGINIDANNEISNTLPGPTIAATAPTGTEGALWYDTTNDVLMAHDGTAWKEAGTQMKVLSYGHSTWQDFLDAYNENAIVYCRASSNSNPGTGTQGRMAFMAYVNSATPTEVEFQYYRSRSDHNTAANQLDQVFVYKLTSASGGTWTVTERNTGAKAVAGTGISLGWGSGNMTISADTSVLATKTYVDEHDTVVSSTAPSSPTEGMLWYDTANDQLKVYDGTNWNATGKEYNAGEGIAIGTVHSDMQGPAPDGFHIPMQSEWEALCEILTSTFSMAGNATTMGTYLKMPAAGFRYWNDAAVYRVGEYGEYWSSTPYSRIAFSLRFDSSHLDTDKDDTRAFGLSLRCFKDKPVIPTSSWTTLYDGSSVATGAGVFYNATDGLISASGDGATRYTIMDKNLGATTVYNQGDTLTDANCGNFYQWGNNYGFSHSGTVTTSSTKVDASNYGPGNYYNSSTFITTTSNIHDWSSVINNNLWGGETQGTWMSDEGNSIINTGVLSVNGQTGAVTVNSDVKVFEVPAVNDDISDMITRISAGKGVILHEMVSGTDAFYKVDYHDDVNCEITASLIYSYNGGYARVYTIEYNYSTKKVSTKTSSLTYFFAPETAGTQGQVLTKTNSGYEWAAPQGTTYNAGEGIEIKDGPDYSAMQGPAPTGYHVPQNSERVALCGILTSTFGLGNNATTMGTYLKMPMAGNRNSSASSVRSVGSDGYYWSSTAYSADIAYNLNFNSSYINPQNGSYRAGGYSIRCFKDTPVIPDNNWTPEYQPSRATGQDVVGIYHNSTLGLISISGDGTTWYTIQDKNLGATTVYNQGDTLTDANCGYYFQWGNNYGFPHSGTVTTSSTKVDASNYGPGNYYNSSTFITASASPYDWSSVQNDNLRGGVTGIVILDNAITNTGVLSVNGQAGNVTIQGGIQLAPNSEYDIKYHWYGKEDTYKNNISQYYTDEEGDTAYFTTDE